MSQVKNNSAGSKAEVGDVGTYLDPLKGKEATLELNSLVNTSFNFKLQYSPSLFALRSLVNPVYSVSSTCLLLQEERVVTLLKAALLSSFSEYFFCYF